MYSLVAPLHSDRGPMFQPIVKSAPVKLQMLSRKDPKSECFFSSLLSLPFLSLPFFSQCTGSSCTPR